MGESKFFTLNSISGPLPLARGGLGWGPPWRSPHHALIMRRDLLYLGWSNLFLREARSPKRDPPPTYSFVKRDRLRGTPP
ncbi:hypothetical protein [Laspinema olomoucense]|uniref:hypothetical protein n=1 Tax=Laspinema olomoucense TaxID=3231600 RepID=UPI0021BAA26F|nr:MULTISPECIES: hypothetical protein [unclassified Laspinema]MCT7971918.1 hypothetical protein [Laspinema sp. D3d]MCT7994627.1 hypothetical protein [Laspinema sp. D3c]